MDIESHVRAWLSREVRETERAKVRSRVRGPGVMDLALLAGVCVLHRGQSVAEWTPPSAPFRLFLKICRISYKLDVRYLHVSFTIN